MPRRASPSRASRSFHSAAWSLFYEQGYENTTVEDIVERSATSKGSFYHYFDGKAELVGSLSYLFDSKYEALAPTLPADMSAFEKLLYLNRELFLMIENSVPMDLLTMLYSSQLTLKGDRNLLDRNRTYYKLLRRIAVEGFANGEFDPAVSVNELVKAYALCERAILSDWCLCNGEYALSKYSASLLPTLLQGFLRKE